MFAWVMAASLVIGAPALKDKRKAVEPPAGEWAVESWVSNGKETRAAQGAKCRFTRTARRFADRDLVRIGDDQARFFANDGHCRVLAPQNVTAQNETNSKTP
jgi:hypothetical protein